MKNITSYYDNVISEYSPYKDAILYQIIITLIKETYLKNSFDRDIKDLLNINNCILDDNSINSVLILNGFDISLIDKIPNIDKLKIISNCVDINSYKGSVLCFQRILDSFDYNIDIYNLYLMSKNNNLLYPRLLCSQSKLSQSQLSLTENVELPENVNFLIRNGVNQTLYNNTIFPIKTNLLLLNNSININENVMDLYIGTGVLNHYSDYKILLKLDNDRVYVTNIKKTFLILYYLHSYSSNSNTIFSPVISADNILFDFKIEDIPKIEKYLSNIRSNSGLIDFMNTFLTPICSNFSTAVVNYNVELSEIKTYLDDYPDVELLIGNILDSLNLWLDSIDKNHAKYLLNVIPMYKKYIKTSTPYKLLNYFKHISNQFIHIDSVIVTINNNMSNIFIDELITIHT